MQTETQKEDKTARREEGGTGMHGEMQNEMGRNRPTVDEQYREILRNCTEE